MPNEHYIAWLIPGPAPTKRRARDSEIPSRADSASVRPCDPKMPACFFQSSPAIFCHFLLTFSRLPPGSACQWHKNLLTPTKLPRVSTGFHGSRFPFAGFWFLRVSPSPSLHWSVISPEHKNSSLARHLQSTAGVTDPRCHFLSRDATNGAIQFSPWLIMIIVDSLHSL